MRNHRQRMMRREIRAAWRDRLILLRRFQVPLLAFVFVVVGAGISYFLLSKFAGEPPNSILESFYLILNMIFLQGYGIFPRTWYLQVYFFCLPVIGLGILAQGLADFGLLFFNRHSRGKEWEVAVASTMAGHVVLVGLGHLGYRVACKLHEMEQDVVVIEVNPALELVEDIKRMGIPVIINDATRDTALEESGVERAHTIILCTQNDSLNLHIALKARAVNKDIEVIVRIFEDDFARELESQFGFHAMSATSMAAPLFASIAAEMDITPSIVLDGQPKSLAKLKLKSNSALLRHKVSTIEIKYGISVIALSRGDAFEYKPDPDIVLDIGYSIAIIGSPQQINQVVHDNLL